MSLSGLCLFSSRLISSTLLVPNAFYKKERERKKNVTVREACAQLLGSLGIETSHEVQLVSHSYPISTEVHYGMNFVKTKHVEIKILDHDFLKS